VAHEIHEQIEHAGHAGHDGGSRLPQFIGITIAILGVLLALCSAQLGAARTELVATMVEANDTSLKHQTISTKTLMLLANLEQLKALEADEGDLKKADEELAKLDGEVKNPETTLILKAYRLHTKKILDTVTPTDDVMVHFAGNIRVNEKEAEAAKEWAESYEGAVQAHAATAEHFEISLLGAEIGIVVASVGLLLAKKALFARGAWGVAILLGVLSLSVAAWTKVENSRALHAAEQKIRDSKHHYEELLAKKTSDTDEKMLEEIEKKKKPMGH
jgi:hypothetical protein